MPGSASSTGARAASRSIRCARSSKTRRRERRRVARGAAHHHVRRRCVRSALPPKHTPKGGRVGQGSVYEMGRLCPPVRQGIGENQGPRLGTVFFYLLSINFIVFCQHPLRWPPFLRMRLSKGDRRARGLSASKRCLAAGGNARSLVRRELGRERTAGRLELDRAWGRLYLRRRRRRLRSRRAGRSRQQRCRHLSLHGRAATSRRRSRTGLGGGRGAGASGGSS